MSVLERSFFSATAWSLVSSMSVVAGCSGAAGMDVSDAGSIVAENDAGGGGGGSGSSSGGASEDAGTGGGSSGGGRDAGSGSGGNVDAGGGGSGGDAGSADPDAATGSDAGSGWDLTGWQLQLPIGSPGAPTMIDNPNNFTDAYFYVDTDGALTFMDPRTGVTTSGSVHPRSELREDTSGWAATGTNTMTATVAVPLVPSTVTIGQVFQAPSAPSKPLLELQYKAGGAVQILLENTNQGGSSNTYPVGTVTDKEKFDYAVSLSNDKIEITINGKATPFTMPSSFVGETFYFKWGDYDQTATSGTATTTPGTIVKFYAHAVVHK